MLKLVDHIKNQNVEFQFARESQLFYKTSETNLVFPVPIEDMGKGTFLRDDKAIYFMRYIRKYLQKMAEESN